MDGHGQLRSGPDVQMYRRLNYGQPADFTMLDTRPGFGPGRPRRNVGVPPLTGGRDPLTPAQTMYGTYSEYPTA